MAPDMRPWGYKLPPSANNWASTTSTTTGTCSSGHAVCNCASNFDVVKVYDPRTRRWRTVLVSPAASGEVLDDLFPKRRKSGLRSVAVPLHLTEPEPLRSVALPPRREYARRRC